MPETEADRWREAFSLALKDSNKWMAHAEALEASREAVIAQRDDNWRRLCEANTRAEALEAERDALLDFMEDWRDRLQAARRAALTGPGEPE